MSIFSQLKIYSEEIVTAAVAAAFNPDDRMSIEEAAAFSEKVASLIYSLELISDSDVDHELVYNSVAQLLETVGTIFHRIGRIL